MRRTVIYTAGLMIAAGASLALAGPAAAAPDYRPRPTGGYQQPSNYKPFNPASALLSQNLVQTNVSTQVVMSNFGNTQIGNGNVMGPGTAVATNWTAQNLQGFTGKFPF